MRQRENRGDDPTNTTSNVFLEASYQLFPFLSTRVTPPEAMHTKGKRKPRDLLTGRSIHPPLTSVYSPRLLPLSKQPIRAAASRSVLKASYCQSYILIDSTRTTPFPPFLPPSPYMVPAGAPWWGGEGEKKLKNILSSFFRIFEKKTQKRRQRRGTQEGMEGGGQEGFPKGQCHEG